VPWPIKNNFVRAKFLDVDPTPFMVPSVFQAVRIPSVVYRELATPTPPVELLAVWKSDSTSQLLHRFIAILKKSSGEPVGGHTSLATTDC
jgi:hypothetical protein